MTNLYSNVGGPKSVLNRCTNEEKIAVQGEERRDFSRRGVTVRRKDRVGRRVGPIDNYQCRRMLFVEKEKMNKQKVWLDNRQAFMNRMGNSLPMLTIKSAWAKNGICPPYEFRQNLFSGERSEAISTIRRIEIAAVVPIKEIGTPSQ